MGRLNADPSVIGPERFAANWVAAQPQIMPQQYNRCVCRSPSWYRRTSLHVGDTVHGCGSFGGDRRRRQATVQISVRPGNVQQHEILVRRSRLRTASITKSPAKYEKLCSSDRPPALRGERHGAGGRAEQDCPPGDPPARMAIKFQGKHYTGESSSLDGVIRESVWRSCNDGCRVFLPGGGLT